MRRALLIPSCLVLLSLSPRTVLAEGSERDRVAKAESLFRSAKEADARGDLTTACSQFAESQKLDPAVGTLLNLADCETRTGQSSAALEHYQAARAQMSPEDTRRQFANDQIASLSPKPAAPSPALHDAVTPSPGASQEDRFAISAMLGYSGDDMSFGLGLRAGKVFFSHVYLGATFIYQLGQSTSTGVASEGVQANVSSSVSAFYVGPEAGYDFEIPIGGSSLVLRPYVGMGVDGYVSSVSASGTGTTTGFGVTTTTDGTSSSSTKTGFAVWPGATVIYGLPASSFFLMADGRAITIPGGPAFGMFAGAGIHL
jgi:hypothetical protein